MSYPGVGASYRRCIVCGKVFLVYKSEALRRGARFCTRPCFYKGLRAFSQALADGRLELILAEERERVVKAGSSMEPTRWR